MTRPERAQRLHTLPARESLLIVQLRAAGALGRMVGAVRSRDITKAQEYYNQSLNAHTNLTHAERELDKVKKASLK